MSEKKETPNSSNDKELNDITDDFGDVFTEIKEKSDTPSEESQPEQESAIRGIFGRIKKKNSRQSDFESKTELETQKKTSSMKLSESQEIIDLSQKVTESIKKEAVVIVEAEEKNNGVTTITMKIPKLTDEKLEELSKEQNQTKVSEKPAEEKTEGKKSQEEKAQHEKQKSSDEVENIGEILKNPKVKEEQAEQPSAESDISENYSNDLPQDTDEKPSFKTKLSKFFSAAKEKTLYYLGFEDDEDYEDDVIFSTSSGVERLKNANPLDFDEEYKENIVYQAPAEEKKDDKPDLLKVAAQNTTINSFNLSDDKPKENAVKLETKSEIADKPVTVEVKEEVADKPLTAEVKKEVADKPVTAEVKKEVIDKSVTVEVKKEVTDKPVTVEVKEEVVDKPLTAEVKKEVADKSVTAEIKTETKPVVKKDNAEDLTFDEILAEEKRNRISIDIALDDENLTEDSADLPLSDQLDFSILSEQIAGDVLREPRKLRKKNVVKPKISQETAKPIEVESKFEETTKSIETESKSEETTKSIETESKSEETAKPVETESKSEETAKPIEMESKSEETAKPMETESNSEEIAKPMETESKSEETAKPVETESKSEEMDINFKELEKQIKAEINVEKPVQPVKVEAEKQIDDFDFDSPFIQIIDMPKRNHTAAKNNSESSEQPVIAEVKQESDEQPVVAEVKQESDEQPVVAEAKQESDEQPVVAEAKQEPSKQPIVGEVKQEPSEQPVVAEAKQESSEQPVVAEIKQEPSKQPIVGEVKQESSEQPVIKLIDKSQPKQPVTKDTAKVFNPVIIQNEKPIQEFKLDFAKEYQDVPKTMLTYSRPSGKQDFVVMAGKFTKTVRSEYRAYRYRPKPPEPPTLSDIKQNPPTTEKPKQQDKTENDESGKSSFLSEFSLKKHRKKPEPEKPIQKNEPVQKSEPKTQDKQQTEQKHTSVVKPVHKQEQPQAVKQEEIQKAVPTKSKKPVVPIVPPVAPPVAPSAPPVPAVKSVVPSFMRKKQRPKIMPDIKEKEEPVQQKSEKIEKFQPKAENKSKTSKARKAIKKKTQMLKLFSSDEDLDMEDLELNEEGREIEEYSSKNDEKEIRSEINNNYRKLTLRSIIVSIGLVFSVTLDILVGVMSETFMNMPFGWLLVAFLNAAILSVCVVTCYVPIINGIVPLRHFKANSDTSLAVASFAGILQAFISFFAPESFINGYLHYYTTLVILGLLLNCIGRMLIIIRVHDNFKFIMKNPELYAGKIYTDERNAKKMFSGAPLNKPLIAYRKKTKFLSNFLQLSYAPDPSENIAAKIAPVTSVIAFAAALIYAFVAGGIAEGASAFVLFAIILTPVCQLIAVNLPIKKLCSAVLKKGSMVTSYESVKQFCDTNAVIIDSNDLYPSGTVTMSGIKTFSGSKVDDAIRGAAAVMLAVKAPMSSMFDNIIKSKRDTLPHVESVIYEDGLGLVGWVAGQRILLGNRRLLEAHGIKVPPADYEKKYTDKSKQAVYLSLGGELVAMFIVTYNGSSAIAEELRNLEQNGVTLLVRTIDSNITQDRIAEDFGVFYRSVKILPTGLGNITKEMTDTPDEETRAYIATKGGIQSFARAISGCIRIKSNVTLSIFLQMAGIFLGFVLVGVITFISGIARLNILELLILYVFSIIVGIVAPTIRKP